MSPTGATAAIAAAAKKKKDQEEEEKLTNYKSDELDGWEFKIMRSTFGRFGKQEYLNMVCQEEAKAGWEMVEKFDNERIRFKRRIEKRRNDQFLKVDPYRTSISGKSGAMFGIIAGILGLVLGVAVLFFVIASNNGYSIEFSKSFITYFVFGLMVLIGLIVVIMKRKQSDNSPG